MTNSSYITLFQWISMSGLVLALVSGIGLWVFTSKQDDEKERVIAGLHNTTEALRMYSDVALLGPTGTQFRAGAGISISTPLSDALSGLYFIDSELHYKRGSEFDARYDAIIQTFPRFPFTYFALADSLKIQGKPRWKSVAEKGISIFENTTLIEGHDPAHDQCLQLLRQFLSEENGAAPSISTNH